MGYRYAGLLRAIISLPGSPVEGWQVQVGTDVWTNTDQFCSPDEIPGDITSYEFADGVYTAVGEGDIASENLAITQTTRLPEDKLVFHYRDHLRQRRCY